MNKSCFDVLIIGAGPVGLYCASLANDKGLKVLLIEATSNYGGQPLLLYPNKLIHDYPSYEQIKASELIEKLHRNVINHNIEIWYQQQLLDFVKKEEEFECQLIDKQICTNAIIISTGNGFFTPNKLEIPGANTDKVKYIVNANYSYYDNKNIIILGGGDSAVDFANNIKTNSSANVTIMHRRDVFRANGENVKQLTNNNVNIILNTELIEIKDQNLFYKNKLDNKIYNSKFDEIIVQYGQKVNNNLPSFYSKIKHNEQGKILVDRWQQTNNNLIYGIGNCCYYEHRGNLISIGQGEAAVAVIDILRKLKKYEEHKIA